MSTIEFSFKGSKEDLQIILLALVTPRGAPAISPPTQPPTLESLEQDPVYLPLAPGAEEVMEGSNPAPTTYPLQDPPVPAGFDFGALPCEPEAWAAFVELIGQWMQGFDCGLDEDDNPIEEQPDRLTLLKELSTNRWAIYILRWFAHYGSLQAAVHAALKELELLDLTEAEAEADLDFAGKVSGTLVQVSHASFPDLSDFYDHSTKWRRELAS